VRSLGILQSFELQAFDRLIQLRPAEPIDNRLVIITLDDADVQYQEQLQMERKGSLADQAFAQLLQTVESYQPSVIASDIYHDFEFEPDLAAYLEQHDHIISVCRISQAGDEATRILPPPDFSAERLGFTNSVRDPDGVMRRHLLGMPLTSYCPTNQSLSLRAATMYLEQLGIPSLQFVDNVLHIGDTRFLKLEFNTGGYQLTPADANGYQVLLNYRSAPFTQISLREVLDGSLNDSQLTKLFHNRIVLIGVTVDNVDSHFTPYRSSLVHTEMPGVVIQAHMVSQVISAVLDQRPLLWGMPQWLEVVWIWVWAGLGGMVVWWRSHRLDQRHLSLKTTRNSLLVLGLLVGVSLAMLHGLSFAFLLAGYWVPLVPAALALLATGGWVVLRRC
jgi:CHASE2 domain-containing sensor protein